jgi:hypothetical protein
MNSSSKQYNLLFQGKLLEGEFLLVVKRRLTDLFQLSPKMLEHIFSGAMIKIKKNVNYSTAMKYQSVLRRAGALTSIQEISYSKKKIKTIEPFTPLTSPRSLQKKSKNSTPEEWVLTLSDVGVNILPKKKIFIRDVDTHRLTLAKLGVRLLPETKHLPSALPSTEHIHLEAILEMD